MSAGGGGGIDDGIAILLLIKFAGVPRLIVGNVDVGGKKCCWAAMIIIVQYIYLSVASAGV